MHETQDSSQDLSNFDNHGTWSVLCFNSFNVCFNQIASYAALINPIYSASVEDRATIFYFELFHEIKHSPYLNKYPDVDFLSSKLPAKSESV